jgi:hypothetical protein
MDPEISPSPGPPTAATQPPASKQSTDRKSGRSRLTNGSRLHLAGDGRHVNARRWRDLYRAFARDLGGEATLSEGTKQLIKRAATLAVLGELYEAQLCSGQPVDPAEGLRLSGGLGNAFAAARLSVGPASAAPDAGQGGKDVDRLAKLIDKLIAKKDATTDAAEPQSTPAAEE